ncbi:BlaI/MecI/CopY family transcriptional regulator [candidate division KSB1 bacterium]
MPGRKSPTFTEVELEFMQILWEYGAQTTGDIQEKLRSQDRDLADGSIRKILQILMRKGHLTRIKSGRGFVYEAKTVRAQAENKMISDLLERAFSGSIPDMVATLLNSSKFDAEDLETIKKLIRKHENRGK